MNKRKEIDIIQRDNAVAANSKNLQRSNIQNSQCPVFSVPVFLPRQRFARSERRRDWRYGF
jgi:hypothetical protein